MDLLGNTLGVGVARLIMTVTIVGTYPLLFWNIKVSTANMFLYRDVVRIHSKIKKVPRKYTCRCSQITLYFAVTVAVWLAAVELGDVAVMIAFMQSLLGNAIVFILPAVFTLNMLRHPHSKGSTLSNTQQFAALVLCYAVILV